MIFVILVLSVLFHLIFGIYTFLLLSKKIYFGLTFVKLEIIRLSVSIHNVYQPYHLNNSNYTLLIMQITYKLTHMIDLSSNTFIRSMLDAKQRTKFLNCDTIVTIRKCVQLRFSVVQACQVYLFT